MLHFCHAQSSQLHTDQAGEGDFATRPVGCMRTIDHQELTKPYERMMQRWAAGCTHRVLPVHGAAAVQLLTD